MSRFFSAAAWCAVLACWLGALPATAQDEPVPPRKPGTQLEFVPPPMEGTISLGIYTPKGKLVRVLYQEAPTTAFKAGLNGFIISWDGKDDQGNQMPAGQYMARGYMVGEFQVDGEAYLCNDWIADENSPRIKRVRAVRPLAGGDLIVTAELSASEAAIMRITSQGETAWKQTLPDAQAGFLLDVNSSAAFVVEGGKVLQFDLKDGKPSDWDSGFAAVSAVAADEASLLLAEKSGLHRVTLSDHATTNVPGPDKAVTALGSRAKTVAAIAGGQAYVQSGQAWHKLDFAADEKAQDVAVGDGGSIWLIVQTPQSGTDVRQYSLAGDFERHLAIIAEDPAPRSISASAAGEGIYLVEENGSAQRVRGMAHSAKPQESGTMAQMQPVSTWKVLFHKTITASENSDAIRGLLQFPDHKPFVPQEIVRLPLLPNPLNREQAGTAQVRVDHDEKGAVLKLPDGLPLHHLTERTHLLWVLMARQPDSHVLTFFQGDGAVVEQFKASHLANMMAFDCGDFDYAP